MTVYARFDEACLDNLINQLDLVNLETRPVLINEIMPYILEAFKELWPSLPQPYTERPYIRVYEFRSDYVPIILFLGSLESVTLKEDQVIEQVVIYDVAVQA